MGGDNEFDRLLDKGAEVLSSMEVTSYLLDKKGEDSGVRFQLYFVIKNGKAEYTGMDFVGLGTVDLNTPKGKFSKLSPQDKLIFYINVLKNNKPIV